MFEKKHHVHFVGVGGIGMSGIAELLLNMGYVVSGSDLAESETTRRLERLGAVVEIGHAPDHVLGHIDVVVISSAVRMSNPEVVRARAEGEVSNWVADLGDKIQKKSKTGANCPCFAVEEGL